MKFEERINKREERFKNRIKRTENRYKRFQKIKNAPLKTIAKASIWLCLIVFVCYVLLLIVNRINVEHTGQIGDFIGGVCGTILTLAGTLYIIKTFNSQSKHSRKEVFETAFMEMLELHKQNVSEIKITISDNKEYVGRAAFPEFYNELETIYLTTKDAITNFLNQDKSTKYDLFRNDEMLLTLSHQLSYGFFFYNIHDYVLTKDKNSPVYDITLEVVLRLNEDARMKDLKSLQRNILLGHYFRHLYNMVKYVDDSKETFNFHDREIFCNLIRSQLSDYEQILLYYNTLSPLGNAWINPLGEKEVDKMSLLCKYRLVKNCPFHFVYFGKHPGDTFSVENQVWKSQKEKFFETDLR